MLTPTFCRTWSHVMFDCGIFSAGSRSRRLARKCSVREYLEYLVRLAWKTDVLGRASTIVGVLIALLSALWALTHPQDAQPSWIGAAVGLVITAVGLICVLTVRAYKLEQERSPTIKITFAPGQQNFEHTEPKHAQGPAKRIFRIEVLNPGRERLVGCSVRLDSLVDANKIDTREPPTLAFRRSDDRPITPSIMGHEPEFNLPPHNPVFIDIAECDEINDGMRFHLCYAAQAGGQNAWSKMPIEKGPHILTIRAVGASEPTRRKFEIGRTAIGLLYMKDLGEPELTTAHDLRRL